MGSSFLPDVHSIGGLVLAALYALSLIALAITIAKALQFARAGVGRHAGLAAALDLWAAGRRAEAASALERVGSPTGQVVASAAAVLLGGTLSPAQARERAMGDAALRLGGMRHRIRALEAIVQAAPMLGLLGTVVGMIATFGAFSTAGGNDPVMLATGIWTALSTTALGLAVAIPFFFAASWLDSRVEQEETTLEGSLARLFAHAEGGHGPR